MYLNDMQCCGTLEMDGLSDYAGDARGALLALMGSCNNFDWEDGLIDVDPDDLLQLDTPACAHIIFTQAGNATYGVDLMRYIREHRLGSVVRSITRPNPNTSHPLIAFIWTMSRGNLVTWTRRELTAEIKKAKQPS